MPCGAVSRCHVVLCLDVKWCCVWVYSGDGVDVKWCCVYVTYGAVSRCHVVMCICDMWCCVQVSCGAVYM